MNRAGLLQAVDEIATREPEQHGYGYSDSQFPWRYNPAIEQARQPFHDFVVELGRRQLHGVYLQIGLGRHGGSHRAFRLLAGRVITVEKDQDRVRAFEATCRIVPGDDVLIAGDSRDEAIQRQVALAAAGCDVLFLDGGECHEAMCADFVAYASLVRPGGVVAIVDSSQAWAGDARTCDVDRLVVDLERDFLRPRGVRWQRFGDAHAIHWYEQTAATAVRPQLPWPADRGVLPPVRCSGAIDGYSVFEAGARWWAVAGEVDELQLRSVLRNEHRVVLQAGSRAEITALVEVFAAAEPVLAEARDLLRREQDRAAQELVRRVAAEHAQLRAALITSLELAPFGRHVLMALGTLSLFGERPREGAALLRRALAQEMLDAPLLQVVANAYLRVLGDEGSARKLLAEAKEQVRRRRIANVCHGELRGNVLWHYPQLLRDVRGVLQVGAHCGEEVPAFQALAIEHQAYLEPHPEAFAALQQRCREAGNASAVLLPCAAGSGCGERDLLFGERTEHASFLPAHALASPGPDVVQRRRLRVPVQTLDALVANGQIDPTRYNLLFLDTEGTELEVLRGARQLLHHIDIVCTAVFNEPVYTGAPLPQQIQAFLRELGDDAFALRAFEPGRDPARGDAVFRRIKVRA